MSFWPFSEAERNPSWRVLSSLASSLWTTSAKLKRPFSNWRKVRKRRRLDEWRECARIHGESCLAVDSIWRACRRAGIHVASQSCSGTLLALGNSIHQVPGSVRGFCQYRKLRALGEACCADAASDRRHPDAVE